MFCLTAGLLASCANDDNSDSEQPVVESLATTGTVSAAITENGVLTAKLEAESGSYFFTETAQGASNLISRAADTTKGGRWDFVKKGDSTPAYSGTYKGDISKLTSEALELNLTVEQVQTDGKLTAVASEQTFTLSATTGTFSATIPTVEIKKDSSSGSGDDAYSELQGKSARIDIYEGETLDHILTFDFTDGSRVRYARQSNNEKTTERGNFTYTADLTSKLVRMTLQSKSFVEITANGEEGIDYSSADEVVGKYENYYKVTLTEPQKSFFKDQIAAVFNTVQCFRYGLTDERSLQLVPYFEGRFPTAIKFAKDAAAESQTESAVALKMEDGGIATEWLTDENKGSYRYITYPAFTSTDFQGVLYKEFDGDGFNVETMGTVTGTYMSSGGGTSRSTVTLVFTALPDGVTEVKTGVSHTLSQIYVIGYGNRDPERDEFDDAIIGKSYIMADIGSEYRSESQYIASAAITAISFTEDQVIIDTVESVTAAGHSDITDVKDNAHSQDRYYYTRSDSHITMAHTDMTIDVYTDTIKLHKPDDTREIIFNKLDGKIYVWTGASVANGVARAEVSYFALEKSTNDDGPESGTCRYFQLTKENENNTEFVNRNYAYEITDLQFTAKDGEDVIGTGTTASGNTFTFSGSTHKYEEL